MRVTAGESEVADSSRARSRGKTPSVHAGQWVVGALERELPEDTREGLGPAPRVPSGLATGARHGGPDVITRVGVEPPLHGPGRDLERSPPHGRFDRFEIQAINGAPTYKRLDLRDDVRGEGFLELCRGAPFFAA
jgi:hypothetical protein